MNANSLEFEYVGNDLEAMSFATNYHRWIFEHFTSYLGQNVAEVGAGTGNFSQLLLTSTIHHLTAFEPSNDMFPLLHQKLRHLPRATTVNEYFGTVSHQYTRKFDSVVYVNVLEHIEHERPELDFVRQTLKPKGHICIFAPALPFLYSSFDASIGHKRRYQKQQLANLVESAGFNVVHIKYFDVAGILPWYLNFVLLRKNLTVDHVNLYDKVVVPIMRIVEQMTPVPFGKNLLLIGQNAE
ncbi:MAG: methyltransferase domain-containing protein [Caldilineaceae bacterium]|nr:methyltransferase domain-containing protein [Caldilineaceae bacterium]